MPDAMTIHVPNEAVHGIFVEQKNIFDQSIWNFAQQSEG
jgi:hypothetical protein